MKKQISLALAGVMALSLAACGGSASTATSTSEAASTAESTEASSAASTEAAAAGDVLDQAAAAAFAQDVTLTMCRLYVFCSAFLAVLPPRMAYSTKNMRNLRNFWVARGCF